MIELYGGPQPLPTKLDPDCRLRYATPDVPARSFTVQQLELVMQDDVLWSRLQDLIMEAQQ